MEDVNPGSAAQKFLELLWPDHQETGFINFWRLGNRQSIWMPIAYLQTQLVIGIVNDGSDDLYFGCGLRRSDLGPKSRGGEDEVIGIPGVWVDLDTNVGHASSAKKYPSTKTEALEILREAPLYPTVIVDSGNGLHAYWLFKEPWLFENEKEADEAKVILKGWEQVIRRVLARKDYQLDSTGDLARVLRLVGTANCKGGRRLPVSVVEANEHRYNPSELEAFIPEQAVTKELQGKKLNAPIGDFHIDMNCKLPQKFVLLYQTNLKFAKSWDRKRRDFKSGDYTASSYDYSLASCAIHSGFWSDQEIVDMLVYSRKYNKDEKTPLMKGIAYYHRTLHNARIGSPQNDCPPDRVLKEDAEQKKQEFDGKEQSDKIKDLRHLLHIPLVDIVQRGRHNPTYYFIIEQEGEENLSLEIGNNDTVISLRKLATKILHVLKLDITYRVRKDSWPGICELILCAARFEDLGEEDDQAKVMGEWLETFVADIPIGEDSEQHKLDCMLAGRSFIENGIPYIKRSEFTSTLRMRGIPYEIAGSLKLLNAAGWTSTTIQKWNSVTKGNVRKAYWRPRRRPDEPTTN